jgi:hypothetical protein
LPLERGSHHELVAHRALARPSAERDHVVASGLGADQRLSSVRSR